MNNYYYYTQPYTLSDNFKYYIWKDNGTLDHELIAIVPEESYVKLFMGLLEELDDDK